MRSEREEKKPEQTLLQELCGADESLYTLLRSYLYHKPLAAISKKDLDSLVAEAERTGDYRQAIDKAVFQGAQTHEQEGKPVEVVRRIATQAMHAAEQSRDRQEKEGLSERAASMQRKVDEYRLMAERAAEVLAIASQYYGERLIESDEDARREARDDKRRRTEREERVTREREAQERTTRRQKRKRMSWGERREAKSRAKMEDKAAEKERESREKERAQVEREEQRIEEEEKKSREARKRDRERS